jgi:hypothetical protein
MTEQSRRSFSLKISRDCERQDVAFTFVPFVIVCNSERSGRKLIFDSEQERIEHVERK